ncbi:hypothetical protein ACQPZX_42910 [Actinoplanes sp. CA-142083]|uniref:hypothetical protein n=1 Tax=Actinoplanes sp. CA-142083 TaxID=3239903 RepID=UPI003D8B1B7F
MSISIEPTLALAARWVQWAAAAGPLRNPIKDINGSYADRNQPSDVFFLAGTFGTEVRRSCAVRAGRPLFFPAFNMWGPADESIGPLPKAYGRAFVDNMTHPVVTVGTEPFEVRGAWGNSVTGSRERVAMRVWGIWATVEPLARGKHTVAFEGGDGHGFRVAATYEIEVR